MTQRRCLLFRREGLELRVLLLSIKYIARWWMYSAIDFKAFGHLWLEYFDLLQVKSTIVKFLFRDLWWLDFQKMDLVTPKLKF